MATKRRKQKANLGSPPSVHAKRARRLHTAIIADAVSSQRNAEQGQCGVAQFKYEASIYNLGELHGDLNSIGKHRYVYAKALHLEKVRREQIAARKALETHCGRPK